MFVGGFAGSASPQPLSNALVVTAGVGLKDATGDGAFVTDGAAVVWRGGSGSGVDHASFESHTFELAKLDIEVVCAAFGAGGGGACCWDRLKAEKFAADIGGGLFAGLAGGAGAASILKRSPILLVARGAGLFAAGDVIGDAEEKSPKSAPKLSRACLD